MNILHLKKSFYFLPLIFGIFISNARSENLPADPLFYRDLITKRIRPESKYKVYLPGLQSLEFTHKLSVGDPLWTVPMMHDLPLASDGTTKIYRSVWDRMWLGADSQLIIGEEHLPLTCVFVSMQDNRGAGTNSPLFPEYVAKIYLVANDISCVGPINPGYPSNGGKKETWDTYLYYEIRDPTIMMPTNVKLRYRWNEFESVFINEAQ